MNLPKVITELIKAQNSFDSQAYANCFSESAVVFDEGKKHHGKEEIQKWISKANHDYQATMQPLEYSDQDEILQAEISGNFPGSPIVLFYHLKLKNALIESLKITS